MLLTAGWQQPPGTLAFHTRSAAMTPGISTIPLHDARTRSDPTQVGAAR